MGVQLIFVVETNKKCNSDWIYIKETIEHFYLYDRIKVKLSVVYMDGRGNYSSNKKEREIKGYISQYRATSKTNKSKVIYCFDCDEYINNPEDLKFLKKAKKYCDDHEAEFVWFCKDVEQVYLGHSVNDSQKKKEAAGFKIRKEINNTNTRKLSEKNYKTGTSNIINVLDNIPQLTKK